MTTRIACSLLLIALLFPVYLFCEDELQTTRWPERWQNLPEEQKRAYVAGLIHGFDAARYFLYLSGRVAITESNPDLSVRDALQYVEVSLLMPALGRDFHFWLTYSYIISAIDKKYRNALYADQHISVVLSAVIQDIAKKGLKH